MYIIEDKLTGLTALKGRSNNDATPTPLRAGVLWLATLFSSLRMLDRLLPISSCSSSEEVVRNFLRPGPEEEFGVGDDRFAALLAWF